MREARAGSVSQNSKTGMDCHSDNEKEIVIGKACNGWNKIKMICVHIIK